MSFNVTERSEAVVVEIKGKFLGSIDGGEFKKIVEDLKKQGKTHVVIDLSKTDFMDSSAIGALISGLTTVRREGGDMRLAGMEKRIQGLFNMTRLLGPVFEGYEEVEEAEKSFVTQPPSPAQT